MVGPVELRNRIVSTGHMTGMIAGGVPTAKFAPYHTARAQGGAGLIITESAAVHPTSNAYNIQLTDPAALAVLAQTAQQVKAAGCRIFGQLGHGGRETHSGTDGSAPPAFGPSAIATERFHVMPRAMPRALIAQIVQAFGQSALRYEEAGYDGLEVMVSHGLLLAQFLNPNANTRDDEYGGSRENRLRFLREVLAEIRKQIGHRLALGIRISGTELNAYGLDADEVIQVLQVLDRDGMLNFVDLCGGSMTNIGGSVHVVPPMNFEPGYLTPISKRIRTEISLPVLVAGRINDPREAERVLNAGEADLCGMTRAQICDPKMAGKSLSGAVEEIRACIACNQACIGHMQTGYPISCIQHPETGREAAYAVKQPASTSMKVFVAGGGPAGMKAAAVAAERGHQVTLFEASAELGGQVKLARKLPGREEFGGLVTNLTREVEQYGVSVRLNSPLTRELVDSEQPDAVVIATGAHAHQPQHLIFDETHVLHAHQVIEGANVGSRVVIADGRCDWVGMGLAEQLAREGCSVRLAVNGYMAGQEIQQYTRDRWVGALHKLGVSIIPYARLIGADDNSAYFQHTASDEPIVLDDVDTLVLATGTENDSTLEQALATWKGQVWVAGDALAPRTCEEAVLEGLKVGCWLGANSEDSGQLAHRLGVDAVQPHHENAKGHDRHDWSQQKP